MWKKICGGVALTIGVAIAAIWGYTEYVNKQTKKFFNECVYQNCITTNGVFSSEWNKPYDATILDMSKLQDENVVGVCQWYKTAPPEGWKDPVEKEDVLHTINIGQHIDGTWELLEVLD